MLHAVAAILAATLLLSPAWAAPSEMREGKWEITMTTEVPGLPFAMPPMKYSQCLTKEDMVPRQPDQTQECSFKQKSFAGDTATWVVDCKDGSSTIHSEGSITYRGDAFDGTVRSVVGGTGEGGMTVNNKISGRRLGPCQ